MLQYYMCKYSTLLISIETGETVFAVNVFDENVSDDK